MPPDRFIPVSVAVMKRLDRRAMTRFGLPGEVLMENAGRALAEGVLALRGKKILIVCGGGNNGGDGLAAARWLDKAGREVRLHLTRPPDQWTGECVAHWRAARASKISWSHCSSPPRRDPSEIVVDALLGTGVRPPLRPEALALIRWMNAHPGPVVAVDVPSGLDADRGRPLPEAVRARVTVTMGLPKKGLLLPGSRPYVGRLWVGDLGFPRVLTERFERRG